MKFLEHVKLAGFTGLVAGILHGTVDIIARLIVWNFDWFEFYQTLLLSILTFIVFFIFLSLFVELIRRVIKLNITKKTLKVFYFSSAVSLLLLFYMGIILNRVLLPEIVIWNPISIFANLFIFLFVGTTYILLLTKVKAVVFNIVSFFSRKKTKKIINKAILTIIFFIALSFIIDLYLLNYIPSSKYLELKENPNIILISITSTRADHLSLYGYHLNTSPNIDRLAKDAVVFDNAISASSSRQPSQASIFTGNYPSSQEFINKNWELDDREITLAEILRANGYNTVGYVGGGLLKAKYGFGQGFDTYNDRLAFFDIVYSFHRFSFWETANLLFPTYYRFLLNWDGEEKAEEVNRGAYKWLDKNKDYPFFMYLYYKDPHTAYRVQGQFTNINGSDPYQNYTPDEFNLVLGSYIKKEHNSSNFVNSILKFYDNEIFYVDYHIGKLLDKLDELGIKDNTMIIIIGLHGQEFFEHGRFGHEYLLYNEVIHIPLIIYYPKELEAKRIETPVSTTDIFPTILDILGMEVPDDIDGVSLISLIKKGEYNRKFLMSKLFVKSKKGEIEQQIAIIKGDWKLIEIKPKVETKPSALYNLRTDPKEQRNLYDLYPQKRKEMQKYIAGDIDEKNT
ncbi:MAG: sulfatase-like hydrolase/transferase [Nanoarchaeota archaeon]|nr:sulfatase-like hydrolase/transferase [Nanoarchaeota archaeon]